jgi:timeless
MYVKKKSRARDKPSSAEGEGLNISVDVDVDKLFEDDGPSKEEAETKVRETQFDFKSFEEKYADYRVVAHYCLVLEHYKHNDADTNHAILKMFHRILDKDHCNAAPLFFQVSVLELFERILTDSSIKDNKAYDELRSFIKYGVLPLFFAAVNENAFWLVEALFWKSAADLDDIVVNRRKKKKTAAKWTLDEEHRLKSAYEEYKNDDDVVERIAEHMPGRNEKSIRAKLSKMMLAVKDPAKWSEEEDQRLLQAYAKYQGDKYVFVVDAIVARNLFPDNKNTSRKLLNRLKKLGITVEREAPKAARAK